MAKRSLTKDIGDSGLLANSWGYVHDDFLADWRGREKVRRIDEMRRNSPVVGALRLAIEMPIREVEFNFESRDGADDPRLEFLRESLEGMERTFDDHLSEALLSVFYGWSKFTITYARKNGRLVWSKFKMLGHDTVRRWWYADDGEFLGVLQHSHLEPSPIPKERMVHYRFRPTQDNPEGESILRPAYVPWYYLKNIQQIEAIGVERNLAGLPVITPPANADMTESSSESSDYGRAMAIIRNVRNDEQAGVLLPPPTGAEDHMKWHLGLLSSSGQSKAIDTNLIISRYEKRILMSSLAQFLMLGMDNVGALATFEGGNDFFTSSINAIADIIADTFTKHAVKRLLRLNGLDDSGIKMTHTPAGDLELGDLADILSKVSPFLTLTAQDELWLRSILRMPEMTVEDIESARESSRSVPPPAPTAVDDAEDDMNDDEEEEVEVEVDQNVLEILANSPGLSWMYPHQYATAPSGAAPDRRDREKYERKWTRTAARFFRDQERRLKSGLRSVS